MAGDSLSGRDSSAGGRREPTEAALNRPSDRNNVTGAAIDASATRNNVTGIVIDRRAPVDLITRFGGSAQLLDIVNAENARDLERGTRQRLSLRRISTAASKGVHDT
jgi:hypothetical protein